MGVFVVKDYVICIVPLNIGGKITLRPPLGHHGKTQTPTPILIIPTIKITLITPRANLIRNKHCSRRKLLQHIAVSTMRRRLDDGASIAQIVHRATVPIANDASGAYECLIRVVEFEEDATRGGLDGTAFGPFGVLFLVLGHGFMRVGIGGGTWGWGGWCCIWPSVAASAIAIIAASTASITLDIEGDTLASLLLAPIIYREHYKLPSSIGMLLKPLDRQFVQIIRYLGHADPIRLGAGMIRQLELDLGEGRSRGHGGLDACGKCLLGSDRLGIGGGVYTIDGGEFAFLLVLVATIVVATAIIVTAIVVIVSIRLHVVGRRRRVVVLGNTGKGAGSAVAVLR
mmetsp:Transcript_1461/g.3065  ORF Transcript_1461/g.3065 Transcript_1461/m.3065 type:complete len:342 (-) Transcript_1461:934-1959(-)